jgi:hypothetical protein
LKKYILSFFLIIFTVVLSYSLYVYNHVDSFNHTEVKENISYLSSDYFKGRLAGTVENSEASAFIKNEFEKNGLLPFDGNYYDQFETNYPHRINQIPYLKIYDNKGGLIKEFKYGIDYKEEMLNFKKNTITFTNKNSIKQVEGALQVTVGADSFVFLVPSNNSLDFRSSFMGSDPRFQSLYIMVTKNTLSEMETYINKNYRISCYIPVDIKNTTLNNVVGFIEGKDPNAPPIIISAHFDHLGSDLSGNIYKGAFDNASGVSFLLELVKYVRDLGKPDRNIIFAAFNAEEFGCLGSEHFAIKYAAQLKGSKVYNFDMIGSSTVPLSIMGGSKDTDKTPFIHSVSQTCISEKVNYSLLFQDSSDHEAFRKNNIDAITFCDSDLSKIHTPKDTVQYISTSAIDRCFKVASKEILKNGFYSNAFLKYNKYILIFSSVGTLLFFVLFMLQVRKSYKKRH